MDSAFVKNHNLPFSSVNPIQLHLFNETSNSIITQTISLPITFSSGESMTIDLLVTPVDLSCSVVLGYNWLTCYNPLIDWVLGHIKFCPQLLDQPVPSLTSSAWTAQLLSQKPSISSETPKPRTLSPASLLLMQQLFNTVPSPTESSWTPVDSGGLHWTPLDWAVSERGGLT